MPLIISKGSSRFVVFNIFPNALSSVTPCWLD